MEKKRLLAGFEESLSISNDFSAFNAVCVLRIEGQLEPGQLRRALETIQRRHPLLRTRIVSEKGAYYFVSDGVGPVPVASAARKSADHWIDLTEEELDKRMDVAAGPLLRCLHLQDPGKPAGESEIILTFNHTILDAVSAQPLLVEFLRACGRIQEDPRPEVQDEGVLPAVALFPPKLSGLGYAAATAGYMMRQMADEAGYRWRARGCRKPPIKDSGLNKVLPLRLGKPLTEALVRATRRERVTMNSILSAALMLAVKRHLYPGKNTPFRDITFADLRPYLRKTVPAEALGCFMGMCRLTIQMQDRPEFWKLAREIHDAVYRSNRRGDRFLGNALSPGMMKMIIKMKAMRMGTTALSYAGPISVGENYGAIRVRGLHAFTTNMTIGPEYSGLARMFLGEIWVDLLYMDSDMDFTLASRIADSIRQILQDATVGSGEPAVAPQSKVPSPAPH